MSAQQLLTVALDTVVIAAIAHFTTCFVAGLASRVHPVQPVHAYHEPEPELTGQATEIACPLAAPLACPIEVPDIDLGMDEVMALADELLGSEQLVEAIASTNEALADLRRTALKPALDIPANWRNLGAVELRKLGAQLKIKGAARAKKAHLIAEIEALMEVA